MSVPRSRLAPPRAVSIRRPRVEARLDAALVAPVVLVIGPAGSGKTTAVADYATARGAPVAWYRLAPGDRELDTFLGHLQRALEVAGVVDRDGQEWSHSDDVTAALDAVDSDERTIVVLDEIDELLGSSSARLLSRLAHDLPDGVRLVLCGRCEPDLDVDLLRVRGSLDEIGPDDLRFRSWEIAELFATAYGQPLPPDDVAELERRTGGWAAGLHLFHLATRTERATARGRAMRNIGRRNGPGWSFLAQHVLAAAPEEVQRFLEETVALPRLDADTCDALRDRRDSAALLEELVHRRLFVTQLSGGEYHVHEVLRLHVEGVLVDRHGESHVRALHLRTGELLEGRGQQAEAARAYQRAEAWDRVQALLGINGADVADASAAWLTAAVPEALRQDPWIQLGIARRHRADGASADAIDAYRTVEDNPLAASARDLARQERIQLQTFLDPLARAGGHPALIRLRNGLRSRPLDQVSGGDGTVDVLVDAVLSLLGGATATAAAGFADVEARAADDVTHALAVVGSSFTAWLSDDVAPSTVEVLAATVPDHVPWIARLARAVLALCVADPGPIRALVSAASSRDDALGLAVGALLSEVAVADGLLTVDDDPAIPAGPYAVLDAWRLALRSTRIALDHDDRAAVARAGVRPAATVVDDPASAATVLAEAGWRRPNGEPKPATHDAPSAEGAAASSTVAVPRDGPEAVPDVTVRCLGGLEIEAAGRGIDLEALRPRARDVLRMLLVEAPGPVNRDVLCAALWPDDDPRSAHRKLQTAVSAIRRFLSEETGHEIVRRDAECYRIDPGADMVIDLRTFDEARREGRRRLDAGDRAGASTALTTALALAGDRLFPESGAADWVVEARARWQHDLVEVSLLAADVLTEENDVEGAMAAVETGLAADRFAVPLWTRLHDLAERSGNAALLATVGQRYQRVLVELDADG